MIYVVGSGPAGVACATALLRLGLEVTMLDVGLQLEPERHEVVRQLSETPDDRWDPELIQLLKGSVVFDRHGLPIKNLYGSDFPYRQFSQLIPTSQTGVAMNGSLAQGGFSNVWGAAILPYTAEDIKDWPVTFNDLAPHYEAVLSWVDLSADHDDLAKVFPFCSERYRPLQLSKQAMQLLNDLNRHRAKLNSDGITFGSSRLTVRAADCVYCGMCLHGCLYRLIYNSAHTLEMLVQDPNFHYVPHVLVKKLIEANGEVEVLAQGLDREEPIMFKAERVYVACGVLSSTKLILNSLEAFDQPITILDKQNFLFPLFRYDATRGVMEEQLHTMAQLFLEIEDPQVSQHRVHLQIYTYNDMFLAAFKRKLGPLFAPAQLLAKAALERMLLVQGSLPSDSSHCIRATLLRSEQYGGSELELESQPGTVDTNVVLTSVLRKLRKHKSRLRAMPIATLMHVPKPGHNAHSGGSFPMRENPGELETDRLGRPKGFRKVHVVDASIFPSMPATTVVLALMANAHRIASAYQET